MAALAGIYDDVRIVLTKNEGEIHTQRLELRSICEADYPQYLELLTNAVVMRNYGSGKPWEPEKVRDRCTMWTERWRTGDPYSALAITTTADHKFVGHAVLGHGDQPGQAELAGLGHPIYWNQKAGEEVMVAMLKYASELRRQGCLLEGQPLDRFSATASEDNEYSWRILESVGMTRGADVERYGMTKRQYSMAVCDQPPPVTERVAALWHSLKPLSVTA